MIISDELQIKSEIEHVKRMLADIPKDAVIDRMSLQSRIETLEEELAGLAQTSTPAKAVLTFRGRPVVGSRGIFADFASKATSAFSELVTVLAASQRQPVASAGPVPKRDENQILITGTAVGSFGFQIQEHAPQGTLAEVESPVAHALEQSRELLASLVGDDEELTESVSGIDKRAISNLRQFLDVLASHEAVCNLAVGSREFSFRDVDQVKHGLQRIADENVHEEIVTYTGHFQGVLPDHRTFEFKANENDKVITGKIAPEIADPSILNNHLGKQVTVSLVATRLGGGRPRYILKSTPEW